jgi:predicted transcriptional regulator
MNMHLTIHLSADTEAKLKEQARLTGRSPEELAVEALQEKLAYGLEPAMSLSTSSRLAEFHAWLASMPAGNPNADLSRESIYGNRGE